MQCQRCHKNPATVRYAEVVDGKSVHQDLCAECLSRCKQDVSSVFTLGTVRPAVRGGAAPQRTVTRSRRVCPVCAVTLDRIAETAVVGCPSCYAEFGQEIESILEGLHRALRHQGKAPRLDTSIARLYSDLQTKRVLLRSVLRAEDYEQAARLRDEIRGLESGLRLTEAGTD